uniref:Uncharacterized protein n=1 Tax=Anguilla anguilla TaxID=7936 RepID=A0A0E9RBQ6_ANGAN
MSDTLDVHILRPIFLATVLRHALLSNALPSVLFSDVWLVSF